MVVPRPKYGPRCVNEMAYDLTEPLIATAHPKPRPATAPEAAPAPSAVSTLPGRDGRPRRERSARHGIHRPSLPCVRAEH